MKLWLSRKQLQTGMACWAPGLACVGIPALGNKSNTHTLVNLSAKRCFHVYNNLNKSKALIVYSGLQIKL